jgi:hypothetical protein
MGGDRVSSQCCGVVDLELKLRRSGNAGREKIDQGSCSLRAGLKHPTKRIAELVDQRE